MQDWEIECADPSRIEEFIGAYDKHAKTDDDKFTLMALILGSFEEYHGLQAPNKDVWTKIKKILTEDLKVHRDHVQYYRVDEEIDSGAWFPITKLMREIEID